MASNEKPKKKAPKQAAAVCYKLRPNGKPEFLLVRARTKDDRVRWMFPKGTVKKGEERWEAAAREAAEEAGVKGKIKREPFTHFRFSGRPVKAFLLKVKESVDPQEEGREPTWFGRNKAIEALSLNRDVKKIRKLMGVVDEAWRIITNKARTQVFLSYSHKDKGWLNRLQTMLRPLAGKTEITFWDDKLIKPGEDWKAEIKKALASTKVAVLLVSPDFLDSEFIMKEELPVLLKAADKKRLIILWVALRDSGYEHTKIRKLQAANDPKQPIAACRGTARVDKELKLISQQIEKALTRK